MAWSMEDHGISGRIYTIDMTPPNERFPWPIDWGNGTGPKVEYLARNDVWPQAAPLSWINRIEVLTGFSGQIITRYQGPKIGMAFIDGGHGYKTVRHDFYSTLEVAADRFGILFDDYAPVPGFEVKKLIAEEIVPHFNATLIYTVRRWPGGERAMLTDPGYGLVWIHSENLDKAVDNIIIPGSRARFLRDYRSLEWLSRARRRLGQIYHQITDNGRSM